MLAWNAERGVIGHRRVADYTRIPYVGNALCVNLLEHLVGEEVHLSTTVLSNCTVLLAHIGTIAEQSCEYLIYYDFLLGHTN